MELSEVNNTAVSTKQNESTGKLKIAVGYELPCLNILINQTKLQACTIILMHIPVIF
jgi:hypothetical protein